MSESEVEDGLHASHTSKRRRLEDSDGASTTSTDTKTTEMSEEPFIQDLQYNASDGDICVVRVQKTVFKIHRYLLSRDSVMFRDIFSSATGAQVNSQEGIHLPNEKAADFRDLCWALYAMPADLIAQLNADADIGRIYRIALIARKYKFLSIEKWAVDTLIHHCRINGFVMKNDADPKPPLLLHVASVCGSAELREVVEDGLLDMMGDASYDLRDVFHLIEKFGSRQLVGIAYYHLLQIQERAPPLVSPTSAALEFSLFRDPDGHEARCLNRGFYSLTKWWEHFVSTNMNLQNFPQDAQCPPDHHARSCLPSWQALFSQFLLQSDVPTVPTKVEVLGRFDAIENCTKAGQFNSPINPQCVHQWANLLPGTRDVLVDTMADQFLGRAKSPFVTAISTTGSA